VLETDAFAEKLQGQRVPVKGVRQYQLDAPIHAAMRADRLLEEGDVNGAANWRLIVNRINQLLTPSAGAPN
jgi:hypothetical protein